MKTPKAAPKSMLQIVADNLESMTPEERKAIDAASDAEMAKNLEAEEASD